MQGKISYTGADGKPYTLTYVADEHGFQPQGDHLPTPPPAPQDVPHHDVEIHHIPQHHVPQHHVPQHHVPQQVIEVEAHQDKDVGQEYQADYGQQYQYQ